MEIAEIIVDALIEARWHGIHLLDTSITSVDLMDICISCLGASSGLNQWHAIYTTRPSSRDSSLHSCDLICNPFIPVYHFGDLHLLHSLGIRPGASILLNNSYLYIRSEAVLELHHLTAFLVTYEDSLPKLGSPWFLFLYASLRWAGDVAWEF